MAPWDSARLKPSHDPDWSDPDELGREIEADSVVPLAAAHPAQDLRAFRNPRMLYFLAAMIPVQLVFFQLTSSLLLFLVLNLSLPESLYGTVFTLNTLLIVALEVPLNTAMAHWSHRRTLTLGALLYAIGFGSFAFVTRPAVLFADEPTGNLDTTTGAWVGELLFELNAQAHTTLVLVTHDRELAGRCGRVVRMEAGRVL